jgi:tetratricopeptide (TPR) repeat protein
MAAGEDDGPGDGSDETRGITPPTERDVPAERAAGAGSTLPSAGRDETFTRAALGETQAAPTTASPGPPARASAGFPPGTTLASRYEFVRFVAEGAMGAVYEAEDRALRGRVALKTVRPEIAADPQALERFKREIALARLVTHPNVCRIFDLGLHRPEPAAGAPEVLFLTMELLSGETLSAFIARRKRVKRTEALAILKQVAAGLDAAHAVGVVHRDFKSGNVMLVPADPRKPVRAVVTDFGLARGLDIGPSHASISESGAVVGTPAYMAPEQVEGLSVTPAADIYALGIVAYEMITGVRPFDGGSAITVALRRLREPPAPPRTHVPDLHTAWDAAILRCLRLDPTERFPSAGEFVRALETSSTTEDVSERPTVKIERRPGGGPRLLPWLLGAASVVAVAGAVWLLGRAARDTRPASAPPPSVAPVAAARRSLAVLPFSNSAHVRDAAWLGTAVAEMVASEIAAGGKLRSLPGADVAAALRDLGLEAGDPSTEAVASLRRALGSDLLVTGRFTLTGGGPVRLLRLDARLVDAASGETLAQGASTGNEGQLFDIVTRAGEPLREALGLGRVAPAEALQVEAVLPANPEAARLYALGLEKLRKADAQAARSDLDRAVALAPKHPLVHAALGESWTALGYDAKARAAFRQAAALGGALPGEMRDAIEAGARAAEKDWGGAAAGFSALAVRFPDDLAYPLKVAETQTLGGKPREALATLEALRKAVPAAAEDPRVDLAEARACQELGDAKQALATAEQAAAKAEARGLRVARARALALAATALRVEGRPREATARAEEARAIFEAAGDRGWAARCLEQMALAAHEQGDLRGSRRLYETALAEHRRIGDAGSVARVLSNVASGAFTSGDLASAQRLYDQALAAFLKVDAKYEAAATLSNLGARLQVAGDLAAAQRRYQQALSLFQQVGERSGIAITLTNLGEVFFARGDLGKAQELLEESLAACREIGDKAGAGYSLLRLGELFTARGDLEVAGSRLQEARRLQQEAGDALGEAQSRVAQALLASAAGRHHEAEPLARGAEEVLRVEGATDAQALALLALAEALLGRGDLAGAREASARASSLLEKSEDRRARAEAAVLAGRLRATEGSPEDVAEALVALTAALDEATQAGLVPAQYAARLGLGLVEVGGGQAEEGRARLRALARECRSRGFLLVARRAAEAS